MVPATTTTYDPYDEDYTAPVQDDAGEPDDGPSPGGQIAEDARLAAHAEAESTKEHTQKRNEEARRESGERLRAERTTDEFVNMPFGRASAVVTQRMNEESVMRRLKEVSPFFRAGLGVG